MNADPRRMQAPLSLLPLSALLAPVLAALAPVAPIHLPPFAAIGSFLAEDLVAAKPLPARHEALRAGHAVNARDVAGASPEAPVLLDALPPFIAAGAALPEGCDCLIEPEALTRMGPLFAAIASPYPGAAIRFAGHDVAKGSLIARAGMQVTAELALLAAELGLQNLAIRRPRVALDLPPSPARDWLIARLHDAGAQHVSEAPDLVVALSAANAAPLALRPGEGCELDRDREGRPRLLLPARFDGVFAGFAALILPLLARLAGAAPALAPFQLTRKLVSAIGLDEIALFYATGAAIEPLACGDLPLAAMARATHVAVIGPESEGFPPRATLLVQSLASPFAGFGSAS